MVNYSMKLKIANEANNLKKCTNFVNIPISVNPHRTMNTSCDMIPEPDLLHVTEDG